MQTLRSTARKKARPHHYHLANEEALYVLEGQGLLGIGGEGANLYAGNYVALKKGEAASARGDQLFREPLRYLCFRTTAEPDVFVYPDSRKVGIFAGSAPGGSEEKRTLNEYLGADARLGYHDDGEE